ncbi:hypothetical protein [Legionella maioricensis]
MLKVSSGITPLLTASQNGHADVVELLLARKDVDPNKAHPNTLTHFS